MTVPGVGPVVALTFRATVDVPARFRELQGGRGRVRLDATPLSVRRDRPDGRHLEMRRRDDAHHALRGGPGHADTRPPNGRGSRPGA